MKLISGAPFTYKFYRDIGFTPYIEKASDLAIREEYHFQSITHRFPFINFSFEVGIQNNEPLSAFYLSPTGTTHGGLCRGI